MAITIKTDMCWSGGENFQVRLTLPNGQRYMVDAPDGVWTRTLATKCKQFLRNVTGESDVLIRFK